jgi:hypothetical protein
MRVVKCLGDLAGEPERVIEGELAFAVKPQAQGLALHVGHDVVAESALTWLSRYLTGVEQAQDVGVLELGGEADLPEEALGAEDGRKVGPEHLHRNLPVMLEVTSEVHRGHATMTELSLDAVAI